MLFVRIRGCVKDLVGDESAATAIEYGLIAALVVISLLVGLQAYGTSVSEMFHYISETVDANM